MSKGRDTYVHVRYWVRTITKNVDSQMLSAEYTLIQRVPIDTMWEHLRTLNSWPLIYHCHNISIIVSHPSTSVVSILRVRLHSSSSLLNIQGIAPWHVLCFKNILYLKWVSRRAPPAIVGFSWPFQQMHSTCAGQVPPNSRVQQPEHSQTVGLHHRLSHSGNPFER